MWVWAGSFRMRGWRQFLRVLLGTVLPGVLFVPVQARVLLSQEEVLSRAFPPPSTIERKTLFLDDAQAARIERESGEKLASRIVTYYVGRGKNGVIGYAYFDSHLVRTLPETIMVFVRPDGSLGRVTILSFSEPQDYLPKDAWLEQFPGRRLGDDLELRRGIRTLTGASLSARAITSASRRVLAIHAVVKEGAE